MNVTEEQKTALFKKFEVEFNEEWQAFKDAYPEEDLSTYLTTVIVPEFSCSREDFWALAEEWCSKQA